ncbi:MAG: VanZ family protein [Ignavibacteria bacterium]
MNSKLKYHLPVVIICLGIFVESSFPTESYPKIDFELTDKIVHFGIYFVLFMAFYFSFNNQTKYLLLYKYSLFSALIFTVLYGASDEFHQYFVPGRSCEFYDWLADIFGAIFGIVLILINKKFLKIEKLIH